MERWGYEAVGLRSGGIMAPWSFCFLNAFVEMSGKIGIECIFDNLCLEILCLAIGSPCPGEMVGLCFWV